MTFLRYSGHLRRYLTRENIYTPLLLLKTSTIWRYIARRVLLLTCEDISEDLYCGDIEYITRFQRTTKKYVARTLFSSDITCLRVVW